MKNNTLHLIHTIRIQFDAWKSIKRLFSALLKIAGGLAALKAIGVLNWLQAHIQPFL